jgi:hypothetical protein
MDIIREYAKRRELGIVKEYSDEGKTRRDISFGFEGHWPKCEPQVERTRQADQGWRSQAIGCR